MELLGLQPHRDVDSLGDTGSQLGQADLSGLDMHQLVQCFSPDIKNRKNDPMICHQFPLTIINIH